MIRNRWLMLSGFLIIGGCVDTIQVDLPNVNGGRLVVGGVVERSPEIYRFLISVSETQSVHGTFIEKLADSEISILLNGKAIFLISNNEEFRIPISDFHQQYGGSPEDATFNISVKLSDGRIFESVEQKIMDAPTGTELKLEYYEKKVFNVIGNLVDRGFVRVYLSTPLVNREGDMVSLKWDVTGDYEFRESCFGVTFNPKVCYIHESYPVGAINIINSDKANVSNLVNFELGETDATYKFASRYYFTVVSKAISNYSAAFWEEVDRALTREGTIYDIPPAAFRTNIHQIEGAVSEVQGYFYTAGVDTVRYRATKEETGFQRSPCSIFAQADGCCGCFALGGSTYDKPHFWDQ